MTATTSNAPSPANGEATSVASHEVGMVFVHEYYTFLNKEPSRLHCFYNKQSTMSHGTQGEDAQICHGQQASVHSTLNQDRLSWVGTWRQAWRKGRRKNLSMGVDRHFFLGHVA